MQLTVRFCHAKLKLIYQRLFWGKGETEITVNLKEIAAAARVSPSTVSLVLNGKNGVGAQKRAEITRLLTENGYSIQPRRDSERPRSICFLKFSRHGNLVNGNADFVANILDAVELECRRLGYEFRVVVFHGDQFAEIIDKVHSNMPDGILLLGTELAEADIPLLSLIQAPLVIVDNELEHYNYSCVDMDNVEASYQIARYLHQMGHTDIGYLYNRMPSFNCAARFAAFRAALSQFRLQLPEAKIIRVSPSLTGTCQEILDYLHGGGQLPRALVATNDTIALGALKAFQAFGLRVPEDISIIGFDNIQFSSISFPSLTTIAVSCRDMGTWAVRLLHEQILSPGDSAVKVRVGVSLVERESVLDCRTAAMEEI